MSRNLNHGEVPAPGQQPRSLGDWSPRGAGRCVCGAAVGREVARVYGVDGVVPACGACWTNHEVGKRYETVTSAVRHFNDDTGARVANVEIDAHAHPEVDR
jgi:hypothetical protein